MYSKFQPYKTNIENPKTYEDIILEIISRKKTGLHFHYQLITIFKALNMCGFADKQEDQFEDELESLMKYEKHYMLNFHKIPCVKLEDIDVNPHNIKQMNICSIIGDKKSIMIKSLYDEWYKWETETKECLQEWLDYIYSMEDFYDVRLIHKSLKEVNKELEGICQAKTEFDDVSWDMQYLYNKQYMEKDEEE